VGVCDSQPATAEGIRAILREDPALEWRWSAFSLETARKQQIEEPAGILLIDRTLGALAVTDWLLSLGGANPAQVVIWASVLSALEAERLLCAGASGVLARTSTCEEVRECLHRLAEGGKWAPPALLPQAWGMPRPRQTGLTSREQEVFELVQRGMSNRQVALELGISPGTVKIHLQHIFSKTGLRGRAGLVLDGTLVPPNGMLVSTAAGLAGPGASFSVAKA